MLAVTRRGAKRGLSDQARFNKLVSKTLAMQMKVRDVKATLLTGVILLAFLAISIWFAATVWTDIGVESQADISGHGYVAMALGVVISLIVGGGLMALVFFSARNGHDDVDHEL